MKLPLFLFIFLTMLVFSADINAQTDKWWLDAQVCDNSETYHCCCYSPNGVYISCKNCPVSSYQIVCNLGGIFGCWGLGGCEPGGLTPSQCQDCCFGGYAGGVNPDHPNAPLPFGMI